MSWKKNLDQAEYSVTQRQSNQSPTSNTQITFPTDYEMYSAPSSPTIGNEENFYGEISYLRDGIRSFNENVTQIARLHSQSLNLPTTANSTINRDLEIFTQATRELGNQLRDRIKLAEGQMQTAARRHHIGAVKQQFLEAIQNYQAVEKQHRDKYRERVEKQLKIVKPNATPDEVQAVISGDQGGRVFTQSLLSSNRFGETRAAYREVQERHEDIKRIERTMTELAQLFNDMSILVEKQDEQIKAIETAAGEVERDTEKGLSQIGKAVESARRARKLKWCMAISLIVVLVILVLVLAIELAGNNNN